MKIDKASIKVFSKYANVANIFLLKLAIELLKYIEINNHALDLVNNWLSLYNPIYNLSPIELKILKAYIKNNLANSFIRFSKSLAKVFIYFNKKLNKNLRLCKNY